MLIVIGVVVAAILLFLAIRALSGPRYPAATRPAPYYDPEPVLMDPVMVSNPIADIATAVAAEVVVDSVIGAAMDAFDPGPGDFGGDGGFDPGSGFGGDSSF